MILIIKGANSEQGGKCPLVPPKCNPALSFLVFPSVFCGVLFYICLSM